ncbi:c-type cytochrome [Tabrizicola sp. WMC-M-20]|nr:c-type cytochrome [Tabrizicola sp. WMC-M-20]
MIKKSLYAIAGVLAFSTQLAAQDGQGDAAEGEKLFARLCVACHVIADHEGNVVAGSRAGMGPNLYGVSGSTPGTQEDYQGYSDALAAYGDTGAIWAEDNIIAFLQNPNGHLREELGDPRARSKMSYRLRNEADARDIYAYLSTQSAPNEESGSTEPVVE